MLGFIIVPLVLLALFLFLTRHVQSSCDVLAVVGADREYFDSNMSPFFLQNLEIPVLRARSRICLVDGGSLRLLTTPEVATALTREELAAISPYLFERVWKRTRICIFRNCAHGDNLKKRAENRRAHAEYMRLHPEPEVKRKRPDDDTFPVIF